MIFSCVIIHIICQSIVIHQDSLFLCQHIKHEEKVYDVILFGEMRMLNKAEYTYTDYEQALNEYITHVLNMDYICLVLNDVKIMTKKRVGQCEVKGEYILCQGKR